MGVVAAMLEKKPSKNKNRREAESNKNDTGTPDSGHGRGSLLTVWHRWPCPTVLLLYTHKYDVRVGII